MHITDEVLAMLETTKKSMTSDELAAALTYPVRSIRGAITALLSTKRIHVARKANGVMGGLTFAYAAGQAREDCAAYRTLAAMQSAARKAGHANVRLAQTEEATS